MFFFRIPRLTPGYIRYLQVRILEELDVINLEAEMCELKLAVCYNQEDKQE